MSCAPAECDSMRTVDGVGSESAALRAGMIFEAKRVSMNVVFPRPDSPKRNDD